MKVIAVDERQERYQLAISGREQLPVRGNWTEVVRRNRKRKKQKERQKMRYRRFSVHA